MKGQGVIIGIAAVLLFVLLTSAKPAIDLSPLSGQFGADNVARLQSVANALSANGISGDTLKYCLAQILQETGLFTNNPNYVATDQRNNYAGISSGSGYKVYNNVNDFVVDYLRVLNLPNAYPIDAVSIDDFNQRLKLNGYYTDSAVTYGNNLNYYFNLLS